MSREKELFKNTMILAIGQFLPNFASLVTIPILTAYMSKADYGNSDLFSALSSLLLPIATIKIESAAFRFLLENRGKEKEIDEIISTITVFFCLSSICVLTIYYFLPININPEIKLLSCMYFFSGSFRSMLQQFLRGLSRNTLYSVSCVVQSVLYAILVVIFIALMHMGMVGLMWCNILACMGVSVLIIARGGIIRYFNIRRVSAGCLRKMLNYSWPMVPNSLSSWLMNLSDRLLISIYIGADANADYAVANKIPSLYSTMEGSFMLSWQENASLAVGDEDASDYYTRIFNYYYDFILLLISGVIAVCPFIYMLLIKGDYGSAYTLVPILLLAMFCSSITSILGGIYVANKKTVSVGITTTIAAIINFVIDIALLNVIGVYAAALSTLAGYAFMALYRMRDVQRFQEISFDYKKIICGLGIVIIMIAVMYLDGYVSWLLNILIAIIFTLTYNRGNLLAIINIVRNYAKKYWPR